MPYALNERTYSQLPLFFGQPMPHNVEEHDPVFDRYYVVEAQEHAYQAGKPASQLLSLQVGRFASNWFFYVGPALSFPFLLGLLLCAKKPLVRLVLAATLATGAAVAATRKPLSIEGNTCSCSKSSKYPDYRCLRSCR